ncbi:MAG: cysteine synthase [Desulfomicrobium sp.]|nr:cysteine synthase [Pseudomonadota bacterium]MBV1710528.1 cysteine synthase [Desulfomicrobium sp.]MBU4570136.1 cysteine synthase [Pseudomonadota bacterium]MBU4593056.1 cysteine synthase [Pseudomonadota bacterium]MBV1718865.1 cysteine synthase [Desulfomicrobium sp.]
MIHPTILSLIGATPIVYLNRVFPHPCIRLATKLEAQNVGGSIKDRVALAMIEAAEASGELTPDKIVIEATSGNTGVGLAMVCAVKGYKLTLLMPDSASEERKRIMRAFGAELRLTPGRLGTDGAIEEAYRLAREEPQTYVLMDQFNNPASIAAHYMGTGREIIEQTQGRATHVVASLGTSGTAMGIARRMKESAPGIKVVAVEPYAGHKIQGLKNMQESYPPGIYDKRAVDRIIHVEDEEAFSCSRRLAREEGILSGMSAGAALAGALRIARELDEAGEEGLIVFICPDTGERYLSTTLFSPQDRHGLGVRSVATGCLECLGTPAGGHALFTPGPSLDDLGELDAWRRVVWLDVLGKALKERGESVRMAVGLADMDDRALAAARQVKTGLAAFGARAQEFMVAHARALGVADAVLFPLAGASQERALGLARKLLAKGQAYEKLRSVYFDVTRDKCYGQISSVDTAGMNLGYTVDLADYVKDNPADFTLLKRATLQDLKLGEVLETEWGKVRPSWFLQLAATALDALGTVTVMFAGESHRFPHLDNFSAIWSAGAGVRPMAWMVAQPVTPRDQGEAIPSLPEALAMAGSGPALRLWLLSASYLKSLACSPESLVMWAKNQNRLQDAYVSASLGGTGESVAAELEQGIYDLKTAFASALDDNLDLAHFWPVLFAFAKSVNARAGKLSVAEAALVAEQLLACDRVLGFLDHARLPLPVRDWPKEAAELIRRREEARKAKDYVLADSLRAELAVTGLRLEDHCAGARLFPLEK